MLNTLGNPIIDEIEKRTHSFLQNQDITEILGIDDRPVIALFAGTADTKLRSSFLK